MGSLSEWLGKMLSEMGRQGVKQEYLFISIFVFFFFNPPGNVMAPPNKLFSPILSTCVSTLVLLLLLLLFLLYKYNQVRPPFTQRGLRGQPSLSPRCLSWQPHAGSIQLGGTRQDEPGYLPHPHCLSPCQEFPAAGQGTMHHGPLPPWSPSLIAQKSAQTLPGARQGAPSVLSVATGFALVTMNIQI